ncbi:cyclic nucleotide-binding domain-containing protein [Anaerospora sp.]|uniref:cyclic nucleotide-binding domain-containing protein n=1 Tax=Anaerospora sp. TaxID=1960278 RepID=UPI0028A0D982|nr:cyclic nucleotide-binding domain-containing protein [Anaerospora sp.]
MITNLPEKIIGLSSDQESSIQIGIAATDAEKEKIFHLRYEIYVEEMKRQPNLADHRSKQLVDEIDKWAILLYAKVGTEYIGTMRINIGSIDEFPSDLANVLLMNRFRQFCNTSGNPLVAFSSKLMVSKQYRNSAALHLLSAKGYELYCNHHVRFNFGGCNFYLLRLYEQIGCRRFGRSFEDPGYGLLHPFILLVDDISHLKAVRSPFFRKARKREGLNSAATDWFFNEFPEAASMINSQLVTEGELWNIVTNHFSASGSPESVIPVLRGLSETEASIFLFRCGVIVQCHAKDRIITRGLISEELNILLSGRLVASKHLLQEKRLILPGQSFGAIGLSGPAIQQMDFEAATPAEIMVISRQYFRKFSVAYPDIANAILQNLKM